MQKLKNPNFIICVICCIGIICSILLFQTNSTISDLTLLNSNKNEQGFYEAPKGITILEKMGMMYLSSGLIYQFGTSKGAVESGFQTLLSIDFNDLDNAANPSIEEDEESGKVVVTLDELAGEEAINEYKEKLELEEQLKKKEESNQNVDYSKIYLKEEFVTKESTEDGYDENDTTLRFTTPYNFNAKDMDVTSNVWQLNYRLYNGALTGMDNSYWGSALFKSEAYFDRAWTSLKWLCQDYLNAYIMEDEGDSFAAIVSSSHTKYYWMLYLDKYYDLDAFGDGNKENVIGMKVFPISVEEVSEIFARDGVVLQK